MNIYVFVDKAQGYNEGRMAWVKYTYKQVGEQRVGFLTNVSQSYGYSLIVQFTY